MRRNPRKPDDAKADNLPDEHGGTAPGKSLSQNSDEVNTKKELAKIAGVSQSFASQVDFVIGRIGHYREKLGLGEPLEVADADELHRLADWWNELLRSSQPRDNRSRWAVAKLLWVENKFPEIVGAFMLRYHVDADAPHAWRRFKSAVMAGTHIPTPIGKPNAAKDGTPPAGETKWTQEQYEAVKSIWEKNNDIDRRAAHAAMGVPCRNETVGRILKSLNKGRAK
jgi:hypothetical protein